MLCISTTDTDTDTSTVNVDTDTDSTTDYSTTDIDTDTVSTTDTYTDSTDCNLRSMKKQLDDLSAKHKSVPGHSVHPLLCHLTIKITFQLSYAVSRSALEENTMFKNLDEQRVRYESS